MKWAKRRAPGSATIRMGRRMDLSKKKWYVSAGGRIMARKERILRPERILSHR
jgi:hypothetical protein